MNGTITAQQASQRTWDVIVVGAGVAGSVAAMGIARAGASVLLVDRKAFPRDKVCGACLNGDAVAGLKSIGVLDALMAAGAVPLKSYELRSGTQHTKLALPSGLSISRRTMDVELVREAIRLGCDFLPQTTLHVGQFETGNEVRTLVAAGGKQTLRARVLVLATGLASEQISDEPELGVVQQPSSRIGFGMSTTQFPEAYQCGTIYMAAGVGGYVGASRVEGNRLNVAAALDRSAIQESSPGELCESILRDAGFAVCDNMLAGDWRGTTTLTRKRRQVAAERLFVIGDAAGYIEPFTGEGMAWAIRSGRGVAPLAVQASQAWNADYADRWAKTTKELITSQQWWCHGFARALRYPMLVRGLLRLVSVAPTLGNFAVRQINRERTHEMFDHRAGNGTGI